jgi:hypothetical protein
MGDVKDALIAVEGMTVAELRLAKLKDPAEVGRVRENCYPWICGALSHNEDGTPDSRN